MKQLTLLFCTCSLLLSVGCNFQQKKKHGFQTFQQLDDSVTLLYDNQKTEQAIQVLVDHMDIFPEKEHVSDWYLILMYSRTNKFPQALEVIKQGNEKNLWFNIRTEADLFKPFLELDGAQKILARNNQLKQEAQEKAKPEVLVELPNSYTPDKEYPLFIALHGWGEGIPMFKEHWHSDILKKEFILLYIQSSQVASMDGYEWNNLELAHKEILEAVDKTRKQYPIDQDQIFIGGFSQGAVTSLDICLQNLIPTRGFISLCPGKPDSFSKEKIEEMVKRGQRGVILTGSKDRSLPQQREMIAQFDSLSFPCSFIIEEDLGHWFPDDLDQKLTEAIAYIRNN